MNNSITELHKDLRLDERTHVARRSAGLSCWLYDSTLIAANLPPDGIPPPCKPGGSLSKTVPVLVLEISSLEGGRGHPGPKASRVAFAAEVKYEQASADAWVKLPPDSEAVIASAFEPGDNRQPRPKVPSGTSSLRG